MLGARLVEAVLFNKHLFGNFLEVVIYLESQYFQCMPHEDFPEVTKQTTDRNDCNLHGNNSKLSPIFFTSVSHFIFLKCKSHKDLSRLD